MMVEEATSWEMSPNMQATASALAFMHLGARFLSRARQLKAGLVARTDSETVAISTNATLGIQVSKQYLLWGLMYVNNTYFGQFGTQGYGSSYMAPNSGAADVHR